MRSGPVLLKILGAAFGDPVNRQAGSVRGDDGAGFADGFDAAEKAALDFKIFGDGFDDPIDLAAPGDVVFEISGRDEARGFGSEKCRRAGFFGGFEPGEHDAITHRGAIEGQTLALFLGSQARRNDVQQITGDAGVRQVRGDARAHRAGAEHSHAFNAIVSLEFLSALPNTVRLQKQYGAVNRKDPEAGEIS